MVTLKELLQYPNISCEEERINKLIPMFSKVLPVDERIGNTFQQFYYSYVRELFDLQNAIGLKINDLRKESYVANEKFIVDKAISIKQKFEQEPIFSYLCAERYERFLAKSGVTKAKDCFKENTVYGVLSAYKLFYVGCSRARKNLTILIDRSKLKGDIESQKRKFAALGFVVS